MQLVEICSRSRAKTNAKDAKENAKSANVSAREEKTPFGDDPLRKAKADAGRRIRTRLVRIYKCDTFRAG